MNARPSHNRVVLRDQPHLLQAQKDIDSRIRAIVGADEDVVKAQRFVMGDPIDDIGPLILHGRDNRIGVFAHLCLTSAVHLATAIVLIR